MMVQVVRHFVCSNMGEVAPILIVFDIPRMYTSGANLYTSIESIKDGTVYDSRYKGEQRRFARPLV